MKRIFNQHVLTVCLTFICLSALVFVSVGVHSLININDLENSILALQGRRVLLQEDFNLEEDEVLMQEALKKSKKYWSNLGDRVNIFSANEEEISLAEISLEAKEFVRSFQQVATNRKNPICIDSQELFGLDDLIQYASVENSAKAAEFSETFSITQYLLNLLLDSSPKTIDALILEKELVDDNIFSKKRIVLSFSGYTHTLRDFINGLSEVFFIKDVQIRRKATDSFDVRLKNDLNINQIVSSNESSFFIELFLLKVNS